MRFALVSTGPGEGELRGCFGSCCTHSVRIGAVKLEANWLLSQVVKGGQAVIGDFAPELLGHLLPNLIEVPLRIAMGDKLLAPNVATSGGGAGASMRFQIDIGHDLEQGTFAVKVTPRVSKNAFQASWGKDLEFLPQVSLENGLFQISGGHHWTTAVLEALMRSSLEPCADPPGLKPRPPGCSTSMKVPVSLALDPKVGQLKLFLKNLGVTMTTQTMEILASQGIAQTPGPGKDLCLVGIDLEDGGDELRRSQGQTAPFTRTPKFGLPFSLTHHLTDLNIADLTVDINRDSQERVHKTKISMGAPIRVGIQDLEGLLRPMLNDAGVQDFGFVKFAAKSGKHGFIREKPSKLSSKLGHFQTQIDVQCGNLDLDVETKVDLTDPTVTVKDIDSTERTDMHCLQVDFQRTKSGYITGHTTDQKWYRLCHEDKQHMEELKQAIEKERKRQAALVKQVNSEEGCDVVTSKNPLSWQTVFAFPPKMGLFHWNAVGGEDRRQFGKKKRAPAEQIFSPEQEECKKKCAMNVACAGTEIGRTGQCLYHGEEWAARIWDKEGVLTKSWDRPLWVGTTAQSFGGSMRSS